MERVRRRFWTWAITGLAIVVLAAATLSGLFQLAVQAVPGYRADVEDYVREVTGRPVQIGTLDLTWRYTYPSLDLGQVALLDHEGKAVLLEAGRLRLGFSLGRLLRRDFTPNRLELHGLVLDVVIDREGRLAAPGLEPGEGPAAGVDTLEPLAKFDQLRVEACRLNLRDERGSEHRNWSFGIEYAELSRGLLRSTLVSELSLPPELGDTAGVSARLQGDWLDLATWSGQWSAQVAGVNAKTWLAPWLAVGADVQADGLSVSASGRLTRGALQELELAIESGPVRATRAPHLAGFEHLDARVSVAFSDDGWESQLTHFELETGEGRSPQTRIHVAASGPDEGGSWEGGAEQIRLSDFAPWVRLVRAPDLLLSLDRMTGSVERLSFKVGKRDGAGEYQVRLAFTDLGLPAGDRPVGATGLGGELALDQSGGRVLLEPGPAVLELPGVLEAGPVPVDLLEGEAQWRQGAEGLVLEAPRFRWQALGTAGAGAMTLSVPAEGSHATEIALEASLGSEDLTLAKPLMPRSWGRGLKNWLDRSILAGTISGGTLKINGVLSNFPFVGKPGSWSLDLPVKGADLAFDPHWKPIKGIDAKVKFRGNGVEVEATGGDIGGNPLQAAIARIDDFSAARLVVEGRTSGEAARYFEYLRNSPLNDDLAGLLNNRVRGRTSVDVHLEVPLHKGGRTQVRGVASPEGVELAHPGLREPFKDVRGAVAFDGGVVSSDRLQASWHGLPIEASIQPQQDGTNLLATSLKFVLDESGRGPSELIPAWLRKVVFGDVSWSAALRFGGGYSGPPLELVSDLSGAVVDLPAPLGKSAVDKVPFVMTIGSAPKAPLRITMEYQDRLGADLHLRTGRGGAELLAAALRIGSGPLIAVSGPGITLGGAAQELDARAWYEAIDALQFDKSGPALDRADLHIARASWGEYALRDVRYQWQREAGGGWAASLVGAGASGDVRWIPDLGGQLKVRMESLAIEYTDLPPETRPPSDPARWPVAHVEVAKLRLNEANLGRLDFSSERVEHGQRIAKLKLGGGVAALEARGDWRRQPQANPDGGASTATLEFELGTPDIAAVLKALRYAPNLDARTGTIKGQLHWPPSNPGLDWRQGDGTVAISFEDGQLRAVEPGAGRMLGLMNFYALPRRLTLNFSDVVSSGLGFDRIRGDFRLAAGDAHTTNLEVLGPSLRMETRGRIGLATRDYDQQVTVYPDVSAGVTLGALALGGPVIGVLALIAQEILDKPLDQVTQLSYRLTGSWDNPQVERLDSGEAPPDRSSGSPSQNP